MRKRTAVFRMNVLSIKKVVGLKLPFCNSRHTVDRNLDMESGLKMIQNLYSVSCARRRKNGLRALAYVSVLISATSYFYGKHS